VSFQRYIAIYRLQMEQEIMTNNGCTLNLKTMEELKQKIVTKAEELRYLLSELPTMEEIVKTTNSVIYDLEDFKEYANEFLDLKKELNTD